MQSERRAQASWAELETGGGISGQTMFATPFGMRPAQDLHIGDAVRTAVGGPVTVVSVRPMSALGWTRIPPLALGNRHAMVVGQGQGVLVECRLAWQLLGRAAVVVPALALHNWRGIAACTAPPSGLRLTASRPALLLGSAGLVFAVDGPANVNLSIQALPPVANLSLASARQLIVCLIAYEAGLALRG